MRFRSASYILLRNPPGSLNKVYEPHIRVGLVGKRGKPITCLRGNAKPAPLQCSCTRGARHTNGFAGWIGKYPDVKGILTSLLPTKMWRPSTPSSLTSILIILRFPNYARKIALHFDTNSTPSLRSSWPNNHWRPSNPWSLKLVLTLPIGKLGNLHVLSRWPPMSTKMIQLLAK